MEIKSIWFDIIEIFFIPFAFFLIDIDNEGALAEQEEEILEFIGKSLMSQ